MRYFYIIIFYLLLPFIFIRFCIKNRKNPAARRLWHERLGIGLRPMPSHGIWIHAVSVGESIAAIPLIRGLQEYYPHLPIIVTNTTVSGYDCIQTRLDGCVVQRYMPYDLPFVWKSFLNKLQPRLLILMETELWPNLLRECRLRQVPVVLANARLSCRSARLYRRILPLVQTMLQNIDRVAAQFQEDANRFVSLGFSTHKICVTGNIKFDQGLPIQLAERARELRQSFGKDRLVWIAASTHEGEEKLIIEAFNQIRRRLANVLLVSVPRHINRVNRLERLYQAQGYQVVKRSEHRICSAKTDVFIGDTMGELLLFYAAADLAFVGGSLLAKGGQNPLEPAAVGLPIVLGPYTFNFEHITQQLKQRGIAVQSKNAEELATEVFALLSDPLRRQQIGIKAKKFIEENKGAVSKQLKLIIDLMSGG